MADWNIENFKTADEIGKELARLNDEKEKHLYEDDMPSSYYENIDKHIKELNNKMNELDSNNCISIKCDKNIAVQKVLKENRLPKDPTIDPQFGVPEQKKYPLYDEAHVKSAIKLFGHVDPAYERELAMAIIAKMKTYDIPYSMVGEDNKLYKYIPKKFLTEEFSKKKK